MRIEAYTQVQQLYQSQKVSRTQKTQTASHTDRLQISSQGKDFQTAKAAVAAAPGSPAGSVPNLPHGSSNAE